MTIDRNAGIRLRILVASLLLGLSLSGCATIETGSHRDEAATFDGFRTFSWLSDNPMIVGVGESTIVSPLTQKKIVDAIAEELTRKGFVYTTNRDTADFLRSYTAGTRERIEASSYPSADRQNPAPSIGKAVTGLFAAFPPTAAGR